MSEVEIKFKEAMSLEDPLERARILNEEVLPAVGELRQQIIKQRALSVKEACDFGGGSLEGLTYSKIASELGVSKPLIQPMVALARELTMMSMSQSSGQLG